MNEMIHRVASIIDPAAWAPTRSPYLDGTECERRQDISIALARCVIAAMREPTKVMSAAGENILLDFDRENDWPSEETGNVWGAMIDAALKE